MSTSEVGDRDSGENQVTKDLLRPAGGCTAYSTVANVRNVVSTTTTLSSSSNGTGTVTTTTSVNALQVSPGGGGAAGRCRALSVGVETDMVSEFDPSSSDSGVVSRCAAVKPHKFRMFQPIFGRRGAGGGAGSRSKDHMNSKAALNQKVVAVANNNKAAAELQPALPKKEKARDPEKEKRRIARKKEKRATLILGLIMGSFIACWLPFFFLYILVPMCPTCVIPEAAFALAFWLGYMNSALNPAIYTIFNKDFRRAFRRILFK